MSVVVPPWVIALVAIPAAALVVPGAQASGLQEGGESGGRMLGPWDGAGGPSALVHAGGVPGGTGSVPWSLRTTPTGPSDHPRARSWRQEELEVSPGRAFLRSLLVPGWGHAAIGSYTRGGSYFLLQGTTLWMLYKSVEKRASAREERDLHLSMAEARARAEGLEDPAEIRAAAEADERVEAFEALVETRGEQVEDWAALGIFFVLLGAADAFVSAHLQDFPEPLDVDVVPWTEPRRGAWGAGVGHSLGVDVGIRVPVGGR